MEEYSAGGTGSWQRPCGGPLKAFENPGSWGKAVEGDA